MRPLAGESEIWWDEVDFDVAEDFDEVIMEMYCMPINDHIH